MGFNYYSVFGLSIRSDIRLPELDRKGAVGDPDVIIRIGEFPLQEGERVSDFIETAGAGVLNIPGAGRYMVRGGREIIAEPDVAGSERHMRLYLLGSVFGAILHQRGLLPLHSNAVELGGRAIGFMGASGAGKSTMAAWFHDRGYNVLADDVCVVTPGEAGVLLAQPGIPRLRLWRDALESSGRNVDDHEHAFDDADKYNVRTRSDESRSPLPLGAIYLLNPPNSGARDTVITQLLGIEAVDALVTNTYRGAYVRVLRATRRHLLQCLELARTVPIFRLERVWGHDEFAYQVKLIEEHAREVLRKSALSS